MPTITVTVRIPGAATLATYQNLYKLLEAGLCPAIVKAYEDAGGTASRLRMGLLPLIPAVDPLPSPKEVRALRHLEKARRAEPRLFADDARALDQALEWLPVAEKLHGMQQQLSRTGKPFRQLARRAPREKRGRKGPKGRLVSTKVAAALVKEFQLHELTLHRKRAYTILKAVAPDQYPSTYDNFVKRLNHLSPTEFTQAHARYFPS